MAGRVLALTVGLISGFATAQGDGFSELRPRIEQFLADRGSLQRRYSVPLSQRRVARMRQFYGAQLDALAQVDDAPGRAGQIDLLLLDNRLQRELRSLELEAERDQEVRALLPCLAPLTQLLEAREDLDDPDPATTAATLDALGRAIQRELRRLRDGATPPEVLARRASQRVAAARRSFGGWFRFRDGYDPAFTWWVREPHRATDEALGALERWLRDDVVGRAEDGEPPLIGDPIGEKALLRELSFELVPYTPAELIVIAEQEFAWCDAEMARAAKELGEKLGKNGWGDDWRQAQDHVKSLHVSPGRQPQLVIDLAREAEEFLRAHDLITVPALCSETWRLQMMTPERQLVNPYFTGGEVISVSFPTAGMRHGDKLMSLRGNNIHFSRATVHHELIPGHHLQMFMTQRHRPYRRAFATPFWLEGWALYWEMRLWDLDFPRSPEDRIGMLFWRKHRCARIVFSLSFHLGEWTPQQCVDYLVERVGHEPRNARGEVRRSIAGDYAPLYQAAYMLGGLQFRALHDELVGEGKLTERQFHDAVLRENNIPVAALRLILGGGPIDPVELRGWRFRGL